MGGSELFVKVCLFSPQGDLVAEVYSLPYIHWPQAVLWGIRMFVREDFKSDVAHSSSEPPSYYEVTLCPVYSEEVLVQMGLCRL